MQRTEGILLIPSDLFFLYSRKVLADAHVFSLCLLQEITCIHLEKAVAGGTGGPYGQGPPIMILVKAPRGPE
jgi:hypothetical protein